MQRAARQLLQGIRHHGFFFLPADQFRRGTDDALLYHQRMEYCHRLDTTLYLPRRKRFECDDFLGAVVRLTVSQNRDALLVNQHKLIGRRDEQSYIKMYSISNNSMFSS